MVTNIRTSLCPHESFILPDLLHSLSSKCSFELSHPSHCTHFCLHLRPHSLLTHPFMLQNLIFPGGVPAPTLMGLAPTQLCLRSSCLEGHVLGLLFVCWFVLRCMSKQHISFLVAETVCSSPKLAVWSAWETGGTEAWLGQLEPASPNLHQPILKPHQINTQSNEMHCIGYNNSLNL